jgi:hypothetical protein
VTAFGRHGAAQKRMEDAAVAPGIFHLVMFGS